jgi:hypothetical protein
MAAGDRQPAVGSIGRTFCMACRKSLAVAFREPRLAYTSRSWCTTLVRREIISYNAGSNPYQERRASAPRGSVNRTLSGENRALFGDLATDEQQGDRQPAVAQNRIGNRDRPHARGDRLLHKSGGRKPPVGLGIALTASGEGCRMAAGEHSPPWVGRWRVLRSVP